MKTNELERKYNAQLEINIQLLEEALRLQKEKIRMRNCVNCNHAGCVKMKSLRRFCLRNNKKLWQMR